MALLRKYWLEIAWVLFVVLNVLAIVEPSLEGETIPFHFIWLSLTIIYLWRAWSLKVTVVVTTVVVLVSGAALTWEVAHGPQGLDEVSEVPLMAAIFAMMVVYEHRRRAAAVKLAAAIKREHEFVRDASHQLRTPITVAHGHGEFIRDQYLGEQAAVDAEIILDELRRLSAISDRLLTIASAEDPRFLLTMEVDLGGLLRSAHRRWSATANRGWGLDIRTEGTVAGDRDRLSAALDALVENGVNATSDGDEIVLFAREEDGHCVLGVSDSGEGIPPEDLDRIFERFSRVPPTGNSTRGTGLGLAIVKAIAEAHGGSVTATSTVGQGSTFRLQLGRLHPRQSSMTRTLERVGATMGSPSAAGTRRD